MITVPMWMIYTGIGFIVLSCASNAMSMTDRSLFGFTFRFLRLLTFSASKELESLHIPVPQVPTLADVNIPPSA